MNVAEYDQAQRWQATARTWFRKAAYRLHGLYKNESNPDVRWLLGYDSAALLTDVLGHAHLLVETLADDERRLDDELEDCLRDARELVELLERRSRVTRRARLAGKLANVSGRTPEEAAAFARKALELRA